jgi:predicted ester cyclase
MSLETNKATIVRMFETMLTMDLDLIDRLIDEITADDYVYHDPSFGSRRGIKDLKEWTHEAFRDIAGSTFKIEAMVAEGDTVATRGVMSTTFKSAGKTVTQPVMVFSRLVGGKLSEEWQIVGPAEE